MRPGELERPSQLEIDLAAGLLLDAHCPHCAAPMAQAVGLPWPDQATRCEGCQRYVGRWRAVGPTAPVGWVTGAAESASTDATPRPGPARRRRRPASAPESARTDETPGSRPAARRRRPTGARRAEPEQLGLDRERLLAACANGTGQRERDVLRGVAADLGLPRRDAHRLMRTIRRDGLLPRPQRRRSHRAVPFALLAVGGLLVVEGAVAVLWQEPFTAIQAARAQSGLNNELKRLDALGYVDAAITRDRVRAKAEINRQAARMNARVGAKKALGRLRIDRIDLNQVVVQDAGEESLVKGPSHYRQTPLPGHPGRWTVGIAGHRTTYSAPFKNLHKLRRNDPIVVTMPYGRFTYRVEKTDIVSPDNVGVFRPKNYNRLALTACHPMWSDAQRIIVYARLRKWESATGKRPRSD